MSNPRIIIIGKQEGNIQDVCTVMAVTEWLESHGHSKLATRMLALDYQVFDMDTKPWLGDGVDSVLRARRLALVIALHLFGIASTPPSHLGRDAGTLRQHMKHCRQGIPMLEKCPVCSSAPLAGTPLGEHYGSSYFYCQHNWRLLPACMKINVPLIVSGDQPGGLTVAKTVIDAKHGIYLYERSTAHHEPSGH